MYTCSLNHVLFFVKYHFAFQIFIKYVEKGY